MAQPKVPSLPTIEGTGGLINASPSDFRAMLIFAGFMLLAILAFTMWREFLSWRQVKSLDAMKETLAGSLDGMRDALVALRLVIETAIARGEEREKAGAKWQREQDGRMDQQHERQDRQGERQRRQGDRQDRQGDRQDRQGARQDNKGE